MDTRRCQTNKSHINSNYYTLQLLIENTTANYLTMNNNDNQNERFFQKDGQLRCHWGADDQIMTIINRRENSPETAELVNRRIELAKPGVTQPQWNRGIGRGIHVSRRPEDDERRK